MVLAPLCQLRVLLAVWGSSSQFHTMASQGFLIETAGLSHLGWQLSRIMVFCVCAEPWETLSSVTAFEEQWIPEAS